MTTTRSLQVDVLTPGRAEAYDAFVTAQPTSLFYHSWRYKEFLRAVIGCEEEYLVASEREEIRGVLPLMYTGGSNDRIYNSLPFYGTSAGIIAAEHSAYEVLAEAYNSVASRRSTRSATIVGSQFGPRRDAEMLRHNFQDLRIAQLTPLPPDADCEPQLLTQFAASARRNVGKARAQGVQVATDPGELARLAEMHYAGMAAIGGTPKPQQFFELVPQFFRVHHDYDLYVARRDGRSIAALLLFYLAQTVEYFMPAIEPSARSLQPLPLLIATAMLDAARRGFRWWNWGGTWTSQTGVYRFKRKWGAIERSYAYYTQLNDLALREWPRERILATWPYFYVLPFGSLSHRSVS